MTFFRVRDTIRVRDLRGTTVNEITAIEVQKKDKRRCNVYVDGRFCCGLTVETVVKNRLKTGAIVTPERLTQMQLESEKNTAFDKALTHLSATRKTEKQIRDFLSKKGYLPAVIGCVTEKLRAYGFLDDTDYAEAYVEQSATKKGSRLIRMELKNKGVAEDCIESALDGVSQESQEDAALALLTKYMRGKTADTTTLQKAYRHLAGKGFGYEIIRSALRAFGDLDEE